MNDRKKINIIKEIADQNNVIYKETNKHLLIPKENNMSKQKVTLEMIYKEILEIKQRLDRMERTPTMAKELKEINS